ncbi:MAG: hypothetical protein H6839_11455 [Planctomycetes bacterium]|nr:hypothetical protein [Planctomycetota bacterium]
MEEVTLPCPGCGQHLIVPGAPAVLECHACGEQLRVFNNATARGLHAGSQSPPAYGGAVRYVVLSGNPEEYHNWLARYEALQVDYRRFRWNRIRWYVATAIVLVAGVTAAVALGLAGGWTNNSDFGAACGLVGLGTLLVITLTAAIGSHYQRVEARALYMLDEWKLREPLHGKHESGHDD